MGISASPEEPDPGLIRDLIGSAAGSASRGSGATREGMQLAQSGAVECGGKNP